MKLTVLKWIILLASCLLQAITPAGAQLLQPPDILLEPSQLVQNNYSENGNGAFIQQIGNANELELIQRQSGAEGNLARVLQNGNLNQALIQQSGQNNQFSLMQQGNHNSANLLVQGVGNQLVGIQEGNRNKIVQELIHSERVYAEMIQQGHDNTIISVIEGARGSEFRVRQIGNGMKVIIRETGY